MLFLAKLEAAFGRSDEQLKLQQRTREASLSKLLNEPLPLDVTGLTGRTIRSLIDGLVPNSVLEKAADRVVINVLHEKQHPTYSQGYIQNKSHLARKTKEREGAVSQILDRVANSKGESMVALYYGPIVLEIRKLVPYA